MGSGYPKYAAPPEVFVLWCTPFQTVVLSTPVVTDLPTVNNNFLLNPVFNSSRHSYPSLLFGKYAYLEVPE